MQDDAYDILLNSKGYILARSAESTGPRAWRAYSIGASTTKEVGGTEGPLPPTLQFTWMWSDLTSGFGADVEKGQRRYHTSYGGDARFSDGVRVGPLTHTITVSDGANVRKFAEFNGTLFVLTSQYCYRINPDLTLTLENDFGVGKTAFDMVAFNNVLVVAMGWSEGIWVRNTSGTWTQATSVKMGHLAVLNNRLWGSSSAYAVKNCASDPTVSTNWSAAYTIGDQTHQITMLLPWGELLVIGKTDGPYALDASGYGIPLAPELGVSPYSLNCFGMSVWHGVLFVPHRRGLFVVSNRGDGGFLIQRATPAANDYASDAIGRVTAMAGDDAWLYFGLLNPISGSSFIVAARESRQDEEGPMIYHPIIAETTNVTVNAMIVSGIFQYLFYGANQDIRYVVLPRGQSNPRYDPNCEYGAQATLRLSRYDGGSPGTLKTFRGIVLEADGLGAASTIDVYVQVDDGPLALAGTASTSPRHHIAIAGLSGYSIRLTLVFNQPSGNSTILLHRVSVIGIERPNQLMILEARVVAADNLATRLGRKDSRRGVDIVEELRALARGNQPVLLRDPLGGERKVMVLAPVEETEYADERTIGPAVVCTVKMVEVPEESTPIQSLQYFVIGVSHWDTDRHVFR